MVYWILSKTEKKARISALHIYISIIIRDLSQCSKARKVIKGIHFGKKELFEDDMNVYVEDSKLCTKYLLEVIAEFNKGLSCNVYAE